jgi:hypothetical protein
MVRRALSFAIPTLLAAGTIAAVARLHKAPPPPEPLHCIQPLAADPFVPVSAIPSFVR